jgi:hypothetical protein
MFYPHFVTLISDMPFWEDTQCLRRRQFRKIQRKPQDFGRTEGFHQPFPAHEEFITENGLSPLDSLRSNTCCLFLVVTSVIRKKTKAECKVSKISPMIFSLYQHFCCLNLLFLMLTDHQDVITTYNKVSF